MLPRIDEAQEFLKFSMRGYRVSQHQQGSVSNLLPVLAVSALLVWSAADSMAQHTTVEKNGVGGRIETDYNTAGKATEMRTIGADGKLQQKAEYEYLPGYYVAQKIDTSYWPNGRVRRVAHNTYDASANFTGEFIQLFDQSGKLAGGHKLTHDPWTGLYRCYEWSVVAHDSSCRMPGRRGRSRCTRGAETIHL
jgi:hypothetical protein